MILLNILLCFFFKFINFRFTSFYILSVDIVSLLTVVASGLRLPIYASCQLTLRSEMIHFARILFLNDHLTERRHNTLVEENNGNSTETIFLTKRRNDDIDNC